MSHGSAANAFNTKTAKPSSTAKRFSLFALIAGIVATLTTTSAKATDTTLTALKPYSIKYKVVHDGDDVGTAYRKLTELSNGQWQIAMSSDISYYFLSDERKETSRFEVKGNQVLPLVYQRLAETSLRSDRNIVQNFDWDNMIEQGTYQDDKWTQALQPGYLDQLTQMLIIREHLLTQKPIPAIDISYRGSIRHHEFKVLGQEVIQTGKGPVETAKVQLNESKRDRQTNFWFSLEHNMLPMQVQRIKEGEEQAKLIAVDW
ncbi:DUF3108 domain-containing protein [Kangiella sediminilitoris]|uniref:DUF3108 domain-containing protein n=1 Tax=Kangiella sediminilitoris TaxID=1144748 RepID=UPI0009008F51